MIKTLYDPRVKAAGKKVGKKEGKKERDFEIALRLLNRGMNVNEIADITELTVEEVRKLQKSK